MRVPVAWQQVRENEKRHTALFDEGSGYEASDQRSLGWLGLDSGRLDSSGQ